MGRSTILARAAEFRQRSTSLSDKGLRVKSWEVLREASDKVGVKSLAAKLNLSTALVYKWCQESPADDPGASGARNPLDRVKEIFDITADPRIINWLCHECGGFFVENPRVSPSAAEGHLLGSTQGVVNDFSEMLSAVSRSVENDGQISPAEAENIRRTWENLKTAAEEFVTACERGLYRDLKRR